TLDLFGHWTLDFGLSRMLVSEFTGSFIENTPSTSEVCAQVSAPAVELKRTPLNEAHRRLGGRMVEFGGWDMPVQYPAGTVNEHVRTRTHAGLFDVSHMGEVDVRGPDAIAFVNRVTSNDATKLVDGQAHYSALTTPKGTVIDDLLVYRLAEDHLLLVVNAGTTEKDWDWIKSNHAAESVELNNVSADYCQLALRSEERRV